MGSVLTKDKHKLANSDKSNHKLTFLPDVFFTDVFLEFVFKVPLAGIGRTSASDRKLTGREGIIFNQSINQSKSSVLGGF